MTPFHPQWIIFRNRKQTLTQIAKQLPSTGRLLDIGAGHQQIRPYLPPAIQYLPTDYWMTSVEWYKTKPSFYADAHHLPIASNSVDIVLLLDVLEHLAHPHQAMREIYRVLKPTGKAIIQLPFLYPLHDVPRDFNRWTLYGLRELSFKTGFEINLIQSKDQPLETAVLLLNIAATKTVLNWAAQKNPLLLLGLLLPIFILLANLGGWLFSRLSPADPFMPQSYQMVLQKPSTEAGA